MKKRKDKVKKEALPSGLQTFGLGSMQDITASVSAFNKGLILAHCDHGVLRGGKRDGEKIRASSGVRSWFIPVSGELYLRTERIEMDAFGKYYVVYSLK